MSVGKLEMASICLSFNLLRCLFDSVLNVHPHRVTRLTTGAGMYEYFIVLLTSWRLFCGQCCSSSVPRVWGWLRSKQLLELYQAIFFPPNAWKKVVWPRKTR